MFSFFESIAGLISTIIDYFFFGIGLLVDFFTFIGDGVIFLVSFLGYMPPIIVSFAVTLVIFSLVTWLLNRG